MTTKGYQHSEETKRKITHGIVKSVLRRRYPNAEKDMMSAQREERDMLRQILHIVKSIDLDLEMLIQNRRFKYTELPKLSEKSFSINFKNWPRSKKLPLTEASFQRKK